MFRKWMQQLFNKPVSWLARKLSSAPHQKAINASLSQLLNSIEKLQKNIGLSLSFDIATAKFIVFSDQHKGAKDAADDFMLAEDNYLQALQHYYNEKYVFINLGDCEELWENTPTVTIEKNKQSLEAEARFLRKKRYYRIFGNHDLEWKYPFQQRLFLRPLFGRSLKVHEGVCLHTQYNGKAYRILLAHGHQGDKKSDGNAFSTWVVAALWTPLQRYLQISINTPATSFGLVSKHNKMMHEWSVAQENLILIAGHTHQPVFASLSRAEKMATANATKTIKPSYFNTGCCCFSDGDITGIEIANGHINLIKWHKENGLPTRIILETEKLVNVFEAL
jgi:UDP-2,3-diacylglucosamine pyrophosphatase LpxH